MSNHQQPQQVPNQPMSPTTERGLPTPKRTPSMPPVQPPKK